MLKALVWSVAMLTASTAAAEQFAKPPVTASKVKVVMTAVTLADDCGGAAPYGAPAPVPVPATSPPANVITAKADRMDEEPPAAKARRAKRRCEQTSMQLSVSTAAGSKTKIKVTKVELFDERGKSLGLLTATRPRAWDAKAGEYRTWDEVIRPGDAQPVSYALSQPAFGSADRYNKTYTLKATVTAGGSTRTLARAVTLHVSAPTILPPGVKT